MQSRTVTVKSLSKNLIWYSPKHVAKKTESFIFDFFLYSELSKPKNDNFKNENGALINAHSGALVRIYYSKSNKGIITQTITING